MAGLEALAVAAHKEALPGYSVFRKHHVLKEGNTVLIAHKQTAKGTLDVIAFPKPEHLNAFKQAATALRDAGPAVENPGAIATMRFYLDTERKMLDSRSATRLKQIGAAKKSLYFGFDQTHYRLQKAWPGGANTFLKTDLHKEYGWNWRKAAFRLALKIAEKTKADLVFDRHAKRGDFKLGRKFWYRSQAAVERIPNELRSGKISAFENQLRQVCEEQTVKAVYVTAKSSSNKAWPWVEEDGVLVIRPQNAKNFTLSKKRKMTSKR